MLGATRIQRAGTSIDLPARKVRSVLAALVLEPGATSSADRLVDLVWGEAAPRGAHGTLHSYISGLRRVLEPDLPARARPQVLLTSDAGYRLALGREAVDATGFADRVRLLHRQVAPLESQFSVGPQTGWPDREQAQGWLEALEAALLRWRGQAYADLGDHPDVVAARTALDELRTTAEEDRALLMLALGDPAGVVPATEQATARHPFRERTWAVHALALARSERQADALAAIRGLRDPARRRARARSGTADPHPGERHPPAGPDDPAGRFLPPVTGTTRPRRCRAASPTPVRSRRRSAGNGSAGPSARCWTRPWPDDRRWPSSSASPAWESPGWPMT